MEGTCVRLFVLITITIALVWLDTVEGAGSPPKWDLSSVKVLTNGVREDTKIGDVVTTLVCNDPDGDRLYYEISKGDIVSVNKWTGEVTMRAQMDFEKKDTVAYHLEFACWDIDVDGFRIHQNVYVEVEMQPKDANDNGPVFDVNNVEGYTYEIVEGAGSKNAVLTPPIQIVDEDTGSNAKLTIYPICNSPFPEELANVTEEELETCKLFSVTINHTTEGLYYATLTSNAELDFEGKPFYSTKLVAYDMPTDGQISFTTIISVLIHVKDAQDMPPEFVNLGASTVVSEGALPGDLVSLSISARDGDYEASRPVRIVIVEDELDAFTLDPAINTTIKHIFSAQLRVKTPLDREKLQGAYSFVVKVIELDNETKTETDATATATYSVQVSDIDDEPPEFAEDVYRVNVTEMEFTTEAVQITGLRIVCTDADTSPNGKYSVRILSQPFTDAYRISPGVEFTGTAILFLTVNDVRYLDYDIEAYREQTIVLKSESAGLPKLSGSTTVSISLVDINDNRPKFKQRSYEFIVSENIDVGDLPYPIGNIEAEDVDSGRNGRITYEPEGGTSNKFEIGAESGELTLINLVDYESSPLFVFLVFAVDEGQDQKTSQVQVTVKIKNENDQHPVFLQKLYQTTVNEDEFSFRTPIVVEATDNEEGTGLITYSIVKGQTADNAFDMDISSGELTLNQNLDYLPEGYRLTIQASDNGNPPLFATTEVFVQVVDTNNYAPVLKPKVYFKELPELVLAGFEVADVDGEDLDEGNFGKLTYRIISGAFDDFVINPDSGVVTVNDPHTIDFNKRKTYTIKIAAFDGGSPQLSDEATLTVEVTDANNKKPYFLKSVYIDTVDEKENINSVILTVQADDLDGNKNLVYSFKEIHARDGSGKLLVDTFPYDYENAIGIRENTGEVYIKNKLDKEKALEFTFLVQVEDLNAETSGQVATTRLAITVQGDPRTEVVFNRVVSSTLNEGSGIGYEITTVTAKDPVTGTIITNYELTAPSPFFEVIRGTGEIKLKNKIDYETDPHENIITVRAIANDGIRTATAKVIIKVNDENDNIPEFEQTSYFATVDEDAPSLQSVISLVAKDRDTSSFGPIGYQIFGGLDSDHFSLFETAKGVDVIVSKDVVLDYNNRDVYDIDIIALDNLNKQFSTVQQIATVKLRIQVIDKNNHGPEFLDDEKVRRMAVSETADVGRSIGTISATDDDFGINGDVFFSLKPVDDPSSADAIKLFTIVTRGGIVRVANSLVGFGERIFKMQVFAQDGGSPFMSNTLDLEIEVLRTENNDGNPVWYFPVNNFVIFAPEEEENYVIQSSGKKLVFDTAPRTGSGIVYSISPLSEGYEHFHIDPVTGSITVLSSLDRELKESYNLLVYAGDTSNVTEIRTGRQIVLRLQDKDDNPPLFTNPKNYPQCGQAIGRPQEVSFFETIPIDTVVYTIKACDPDEDQTMYYYFYDSNEYCREGNQIARGSFSLHEDGKVMPSRIIHYEEVQTFRMCVYVTDVSGGNPGTGRKKRSLFDLSKVDQSLDYVIYLLVHVRDVNDEKPKFPARTRTTVMLTDAPDYPVIVFDAVDADGPEFNIPVYSIDDVKFYPSGDSLASPVGKRFFIENNELHADPSRGQTFQEYAGGRFVLTIRAEDPVNPNFFDTQVVTVYVHKKGQAMKVILDLEPQDGYKVGSQIVNDLNAVSTRYAFRYLHVSAHNDKDGIDKTRTDVCFIAVDMDTHTILNINELLDLLVKSVYRPTLNKNEYNIENSGKCYPSTSSEEHVKWKDLWWVLVVVAVFIGVCAIFFIIIIVFMHRRYRRYMKSKKTYLVPQ